MSCRNSINADCGWILKQFPSKYGSSFDIFWYPAPQLFQKRNQIPLDPRVNILSVCICLRQICILGFLHFVWIYDCNSELWRTIKVCGKLSTDIFLPELFTFVLVWTFGFPIKRNSLPLFSLNFWISDQEEFFTFVLLEHQTFGFLIRWTSIDRFKLKLTIFQMKNAPS